MLSSLSSLADRNFVIASLLPVILAAIWLLAALSDVAAVHAVWTAVLNAEKFAALTLFVLALWVAAVALTFLNLPFYRILEGYYGPFAGKRADARMVDRYNADRDALEALRVAAESDREQLAAHADARRKFLAHYPGIDHALLPTMLGNALRSAEAYSRDIYGADSIAIWERFAAVIPDSFAKMLDGARAEMDSFVNAVFLSFLVSVVCAVHFLKGLVCAIYLGRLGEFPWIFALVPLIGFASCWVWYRLAIVKAIEWGKLFRSAFDLYLPALAHQLGYALPPDQAKRKAFWSACNEMFLDGIALDPSKWPSAA